MATEGLNWDDLKIFLAVARRGTLSSAARHLGVSQPTTGRRLASLETAMSVRLFDRLPDGFVPTGAGAELLPLAEAVEQAADAVDRRQATLADRVSGTVRISAFELIHQFLCGHMAEMRQLLPEIEFEISVAHISANLSKREADLLIRECLPDTPGLVGVKLCTWSYAVYGASTLVREYPQAWTDDRYSTCPWISHDDDHDYFTSATWLMKRLGSKKAEVRVNNAVALHDLVHQGVGLGVLPCCAGDADPALQRLTPPLAETETPLHLIVHQDLRRAPAVRAVMDELISLFKREVPRFAGDGDQIGLSA
jgi:DNA-binding transcriptional LysR family regulator